MFSSKIYKSWREIQFEKFDNIFEKLRKLGLDLGKLVLDAGSGNGFLKEYLKAHDVDVEVVALDVDLEILLENSSDYKVLGDANFTPFKRGVFDAIFCIDVAHLLKRLDTSPLKSSGLLVIAVPYRFKERINSLKVDAEKVFEFVSDGREKEYVKIFQR
ncbi:MAG: class I SAM-dependent methyltransferase [Archaeoglobaceae archaeon]|nr:class I SAM-dependent methyltransferase [Archaeoglobaceae archaeon]MDW8013311.1 class I SAM-dependent methyltransferase [Archaeoglobaceae archaeon]